MAGSHADPALDAASLPAMLACRASTAAEEPWLFCRGRISWIWRSFRQVADQVARGSEALDCLPSSPDGLAAFDGQGLPDQVAIDLALQSCGCSALAVSGERPLASLPATPHLWIDSEQVPSPMASEPVTVARLPCVRSRFDRRQNQPLEPSRAASSSALHLVGERLEHLSQHQLIDAAHRFDAVLPDFAERPILLSHVGLDRPQGRILMAWSLLRQAAWVMEDDRASFVATALWARPHLVVADQDELDELALALELKRYRRWRRLRGVIALDEPFTAGQIESWQRLEIVAVHLPTPSHPPS